MSTAQTEKPEPKTVKVEDLPVMFEGKETTIGKLSKKQTLRYIEGLLKEKQIVSASIVNLLAYAGLTPAQPKKD